VCHGCRRRASVGRPVSPASLQSPLPFSARQIARQCPPPASATAAPGTLVNSLPLESSPVNCAMRRAETSAHAAGRVAALATRRTWRRSHTGQTAMTAETCLPSRQVRDCPRRKHATTKRYPPLPPHPATESGRRSRRRRGAGHPWKSSPEGWQNAGQRRRGFESKIHKPHFP
jgi:hypothetical protein